MDWGDRAAESTWPSPSGIVWSDRREGDSRRFLAVSSRTQMELLRRTFVESPRAPYGWERGSIDDRLCVPACYPAERSRGRLSTACGLNRSWTRPIPFLNPPIHTRLIHHPPLRRIRRRPTLPPRRFDPPAGEGHLDRSCPEPNWWPLSQASMTRRSMRPLKRPWPG